MAPTLCKTFGLLEPAYGEARGGSAPLVEGSEVRELSEAPILSRAAEVVDCGGRTLTPA
jgi:hypothetical protein